MSISGCQGVFSRVRFVGFWNNLEAACPRSEAAAARTGTRERRRWGFMVGGVWQYGMECVWVEDGSVGIVLIAPGSKMSENAFC